MTLVRPLARSPAAARAGQVAAAALLACTGLARAELPVEQLRTEPLAVIGHTAAASVGALLLTGALAKLRDMALFRAELDNYRLLPEAALGAPAWVPSRMCSRPSWA